MRLKRFLEMRGADGGPWQRICALSAFWVGLLYDPDALDAAWDLVKDWTEEERDALRREVPRRALATPFRTTTLKEVSRDVLRIARKGLRNRRRINAASQDESVYLESLAEVAVQRAHARRRADRALPWARGAGTLTMSLKNMRFETPHLRP